jgi:mono/diheme cytochrome c family protein
MRLWFDFRRIFLPSRIAWAMIVCGFLMLLFSGMMLVPSVKAQPQADLAFRPLQQGAAGGKAIFDEKCAGCHTIGNGKLVGPDLKDVTKRRDADWIKNFLKDPPKMLASDPIAQQLLKENNNVSMPNMALTDDQIDQLVEFLTNPGAVPAAQAPAVAAGTGDPAAGRRLFTGEQALTNGGPHCVACHTVSGASSLGGGGLGPDLTHVVQRLGEPGLAGALKTIAYPTMLGPFKNRPLTTQEQVDVIAFLKESDRWQPPVAVITPGALSSSALIVLSIASAIAILLFGLLWFFWARMKKRFTPHLPVRKV